MRTVLTRPAQEWIEGWPLGNGITAAMLWGPPGRTVLSLNHVDFWRDHAGRQIGDYSQIVRQARDLMMAGQAKEANDLYAQKIDMAVMPRDHETSDSYTGYTNSFQPIGDLVLELDGQDACRDYRRSLDLVSGTAAVRWRTEGRITQECFVPLNDDVIVVRLTAERQLSGRLQFTRRPQDHYRWSAKVEGASLCVQGAFDEGVGSGLEASLHCDGGTVRADHQANGLVFTDATDLVLLIAVEAGKGDRDWLAAAREKMQRARGVAVAEMRDRHIREHSTAFGRASLCLDRVNKNKEANLSELIGRAVDGTFEPRLAEAIFDMGRYLTTELDQGVAPDGTRVVSAVNLAVTWEPQVPISAEASYGLGWIIDEYKGLTVIHHDGSTLGFSSALAFLPDINTGITVLSNQYGSLLNDALRVRLLELLFDQPKEHDALVRFSVEQTEKALVELRANLLDSVDVAVVTPFLGTYTNSALGSLTLALEGESLLADAGEFVVELVPHVGDDGEVDAYWSISSGLALELELLLAEDGRPTVVLGGGAAEYVFEPTS